MNGYYYILSSLPSLSADAPAPFDSDSFLLKIAGFVPDRDYECIRRILKDEPADCGVVREYLRKKDSIDKLLLNKREKSLCGKNVRYFGAVEADAESIALAEKAFADDNPLNAEKSILKLYWNCAEKIAYMHCFDFTSLCVYAIKLKILSRLGNFDRKRGADEFDRILSPLRISDIG